MEQWVMVVGAMAVGGAVVYFYQKRFGMRAATVRSDAELFAISVRPVVKVEYDLFDESHSKFVVDMKVLLEDLVSGNYVVPERTATGEPLGREVETVNGPDENEPQPDRVPEDDEAGEADADGVVAEDGDYVNLSKVKSSII